MAPPIGSLCCGSHMLSANAGCGDSQLQDLHHHLVKRFLGTEGQALRSPQQLINQLHLFLSLSQILALCSELS